MNSNRNSFPQYPLNKIQRRFVTENDLSIIFDWRINEDTFKFTRSGKPPTLEEHLTWSKKRIKDHESEPYFIYIYEEIPLAICRLDLVNRKNSVFEISILVSPVHRGKGIAFYCIDDAKNYLKKFFKEFKIHAWVHKDNTNSKILFENSGFKLTNQTNGKFQLFEIGIF